MWPGDKYPAFIYDAPLFIDDLSTIVTSKPSFFKKYAEHIPIIPPPTINTFLDIFILLGIPDRKDLNYRQLFYYNHEF